MNVNILILADSVLCSITTVIAGELWEVSQVDRGKLLYCVSGTLQWKNLIWKLDISEVQNRV